MARKPRNQAGDKAGSQREVYEVISFRLPIGQSERLERFTRLHRLNIDEVFSFLLNLLGVDPQGATRKIIDFETFDPAWEAAAEAGYGDHSMRVPSAQSERIKRFKKNQRLSMGQLLMYLLDAANISAAGDTLFWIDYETLTPRDVAQLQAARIGSPLRPSVTARVS